MKTKAFAKINLNLHIHPKKTGDQFTPLTLINHQINIFDNLEFINQPNKIELICFPKNLLPDSQDNIVYKAALKLKEFAKNPYLGVKIILTKNIPITAGLAGGSSDAAVTLKSLSKLWHLRIKKSELLEIADILGKDVPYFLSGQLCKLTGFGNLAQKINLKLPRFYLLIVYPNSCQKPSTGWMYQHLDFSLVGQNIYKTDLLINSIKNKNKDQILQNIHNDFESIVFNHFPETKNIVDDLFSFGAQKTLLSGSGLGIIGFFKIKNQSKNAFQNLKSSYPKIFLTQTN
jgi:4-diphosphocytidyl-2-C-methyl-D-erythritol kinase